MRSRPSKAARMRETAACICGSRNGSPNELRRGRRNASTSSAQRNPFRKSNRAMHSEPQISPHEIELPFSSSGDARIHRCCRAKIPGDSASATLLSGPLCASTSVGSLSTRCCTEQFIRGKVSDKTQRGTFNLTRHQKPGRYSICYK